MWHHVLLFWMEVNRKALLLPKMQAGTSRKFSSTSIEKSRTWRHIPAEKAKHHIPETCEDVKLWVVCTVNAVPFSTKRLYNVPQGQRTDPRTLAAKGAGNLTDNLSIRRQDGPSALPLWAPAACFQWFGTIRNYSWQMSDGVWCVVPRTEWVIRW